jgi:glycerol-3-phosphate dehydrogenase (NAD+)
LGHDPQHVDAARMVQSITSSSSFTTCLWNDRVGLELCGGLKNVLSLATGYCEALGMGWNCRTALWRAGMHEMVRFMERLGNNNAMQTVFTTSAGVGDLVLTCAAGRGRQLAKAFVLESNSLNTKQEHVEQWQRLEESLLNGMKLPDWHNAQQVHQALVDLDCVEEFPLFDAIYKIGFAGEDPRAIVTAIGESIRLAGSLS